MAEDHNELPVQPYVPPTNGGSRPVPDPTELTDRAIAKLEYAIRDHIKGEISRLEERLGGIDRATELRMRDVDRTPAQVDEKIAHLAKLTDETFRSIELQFTERDTRSERESRDNKVAVDAAFAAQKEAAAKQDEANSKAIDKSETATAETINKLAELFKSDSSALSGKIEDVKERVGRIESVAVGEAQNRTQGQAQTSNMTTIIGAAIAVVLASFAIYNFTHNGSTPAPTVITPPTVTVTTPSKTP